LYASALLLILPFASSGAFGKIAHVQERRRIDGHSVLLGKLEIVALDDHLKGRGVAFGLAFGIVEHAMMFRHALGDARRCDVAMIGVGRWKCVQRRRGVL